MASKSIDKEFLLTDDSVNVYGFRMLTSGFQIELFSKNPIGYRMHDRDGGVVVRWENLRIENDAAYGTPKINLSNPLGERTANEVEDGFLNGASCGRVKVLEFSNDPELMLPGQTGPTITKWVPKEIALVDSPGNEGALAQSDTLQLFDKDDNAINLADFVHSTLKDIPLADLAAGNQNTDLNTDNMPFKNSVIEALKGANPTINLSDNADDAAIMPILKDLIDKAQKVDRLTTENQTLKSEKEGAETKLADYKKEADGKEVKDLLDKGLSEKKTTVELNKQLETQYAGKPVELKNLLDAMPAYQSVVKNLQDKDGGTIPDKFKGKDYMGLHAANLLEEVKSDYPDLFDKLKSEHDAKKAGK